MRQTLTIQGCVHPGRRRSIVLTEMPETGRVPRVARLMALAIRFDGLLSSGAMRNYAQIARLGHVSRARITQIMNLRALAPDIQEALLFLPRIQQGRDPIHLAQLQAIAQAPLWSQQRMLWQQICATRTSKRTSE